MRDQTTLSVYLGEDDDDDALLFSLALGTICPAYRLLRFRDGFQLLDQLISNKEQETRLVFLDLFMPVFNGFDTLAQIRKTPQLSELPVFILTGSDSELAIYKAYQIGCNGYLNKPASLTELTTRIEPAINYWLNFLT